MMWYGQPAALLRLDYRRYGDDVPDWALVLPPTGDVRTWLVNIHGHGSEGDQLYTRDDIREMWLMHYLRRGFGILTPNLRGNGWMSPSVVMDMDNLLDFLRSRYGAERFLFDGGSMGGTSSLIYATLRPENVSGLSVRGAATDLVFYLDYCQRQRNIPSDPEWHSIVLGQIADAIIEHYGGTPDECPEVYRAHSAIHHAERLRGIPFLFSHGVHDAIMPVVMARRFAAAMADNPDFTYVEMPGGEHDAPLSLGYTAGTAAFLPAFL